MMLYILNFILLLFLQPEPYVDIRNQSEIYLQGIQENQQADIHFWALNEIYTSNCAVDRTVIRAISQSNLNKVRTLFDELGCSQNSENSRKADRLTRYALDNASIEVAASYLSHSKIDKESKKFLAEFSKKWSSDFSPDTFYLLRQISNKEEIDFSVEFFQHPLIIYSLLYSDYTWDYIKRENLPSLISILEEKEKETVSLLEKALINYSLFKAAYEINQFNYISSLYNFFVDDEFYPKSQRQVGILSGLDYSLSYTGNYSESLILQRSLLIPLSDHYELTLRKEYILLQQSANLYDLGKFEKAKNILESIYNDPNSSVPKAQLLNNLAICYKQLGQTNEYTSFLLRALQDLESNPNSDYKLRLGLYNNLFVYYNDLGDSSKALPFIFKAENIAQNNDDDLELGSIYFNLGQYYWSNFGNYEKALNELKKASSKYQTSDLYYVNQKNLLIYKTKILVEIDSFDVAQSNIKEMKALAKENSDTPFLIEALMFEAEIASLKGNLSDFEQLLAEITSYSLDELKFQDLIKYHNLNAQLLSKKGKYRKAYEYFKPIVEQIVDRAQGTVESETGFWTVDQEYLDAFEIMTDILFKSDKPEEALAYLDKLKTINDASLFNNPLLKAKKLTEKELADEKRLTARIQELRSDYLGATGNQKVAINTEIGRISAQRQELINKVNNTSREREHPFWKVQNQIQNDELVLHFTQLNERLIIFKITGQTLSYSALDLNDESQKLLTDAALGLASGKTSLNQLHQVYKFLGLEYIPEHINQITVIPDNEFYRLPIEVLPTSVPNSDFSFGSTKYMIEDYSFKYFTSLKDFTVNNRNSESNFITDFSAFAISYFDSFTQKELPSLPFATLEARAINEKLSSFDRKKVYSGNLATEEAFQNQLNTSKILHIATHSEVSTQDPLFSTIYLKSSSSNGAEGEALYAYELFNNQLNNELIMLNSCSSGSGNYMQGTGIMGISRALRYAGAKSLGLNLWEVNDKIAFEFSTNFYDYLNEGLSKSKAMQRAKIQQIKTGSADPHFWGAYSIIGNVNPVIKKPANSKLILPVLIFSSLLVGYRIRKKQSPYN